MRGSLVIGAAALAIAACSTGTAEEAGPVTARTFQVADFTNLEVAGPYEVEVVTGGQPSVSARGPSNILGKMVVEVDGDTLRIRPEKTKGMFGSWRSDKDNPVRVRVAVPMLAQATIAGSGDLAVSRLAGNRFQGTIAGSGGLKLPNVNVQSLHLEIAGSGNAEARGRAVRATYEIAGSGNIDAEGVVSEEASVEIAGTGNISANASRTAEVDIAGAGNVSIAGGAKCNVSRAGVGNVRCS